MSFSVFQNQLLGVYKDSKIKEKLFGLVLNKSYCIKSLKDIKKIKTS
ncbi:hypothetical protein SAMN04487979_11922 [Flavobacterium sp. ov086]|nr:hypothetical protein SAMN04487979_11922 [Flavobacterium sp. ov086]